jgi:hypothetical protein
VLYIAGLLGSIKHIAEESDTGGFAVPGYNVPMLAKKIENMQKKSIFGIIIGAGAMSVCPTELTQVGD